MKRTTFVNFLIGVNLVWLPPGSAHSGRRGAASAVIQATARVVPSLGISAAVDEGPTIENPGSVDLSLWMTDSNNLQVRVEADGRPLDFRLVVDESDAPAPTVWERHRHQGQLKRVIQIDSLPDNAAACTISIVDPTN